MSFLLSGSVKAWQNSLKKALALNRVLPPSKKFGVMRSVTIAPKTVQLDIGTQNSKRQQIEKMPGITVLGVTSVTGFPALQKPFAGFDAGLYVFAVKSLSQGALAAVTKQGYAVRLLGYEPEPTNFEHALDPVWGVFVKKDTKPMSSAHKSFVTNKLHGKVKGGTIVVKLKKNSGSSQDLQDFLDNMGYSATVYDGHSTWRADVTLEWWAAVKAAAGK